MRIKTFEAPTMQEALLQARNELGEDAVVLNTKHVKTGGILGIGGADRIELMAAIDEAVLPQSAQPKSATAVLDRLVDESEVTFQPSQIATEEPELATLPKAIPVKASVPEPVAQNNDDFAKLQAEVKELSSLVRNLLTGKSQPAVSKDGLLSDLGVDIDIVKSQFADCMNVTDPQELAAILSTKLSGFANPPSLNNKEIIAIIGPTGVGKTTTLAKLAAYFSLELGKSVAMVTADTFRIGAVEQLRTYARIMGVPLEIALSPEDVAEGIAKHSDKDVILIDTVGRSQRNSEHIDELYGFIKAAKPTQTHLVVSASSAPQIQEEVIICFAPLSPTHLAITKLDESPNRGCLINLPIRSGLGISCMTNGQNVPQDIEFASASGLAQRITEVA